MHVLIYSPVPFIITIVVYMLTVYKLLGGKEHVLVHLFVFFEFCYKTHDKSSAL